MSKIEKIIPLQLLEILKSAPGNASVRGLAHCALKVAIPDEHQTYEQIEKWVNDVYKPPKVSLRPSPMTTHVYDLREVKTVTVIARRRDYSCLITQEEIEAVLDQHKDASIKVLDEAISKLIIDKCGKDNCRTYEWYDVKGRMKRRNSRSREVMIRMSEPWTHMDLQAHDYVLKVDPDFYNRDNGSGTEKEIDLKRKIDRIISCGAQISERPRDRSEEDSPIDEEIDEQDVGF